jgi:hypothetical protein
LTNGATPCDGADVAFYLTRDREEDGTLSPLVDVWTEKPTRHRAGGHVVLWLGQDHTLDTRVKQVCVHDAKREFGASPDSDLIMIRKG